MGHCYRSVSYYWVCDLACVAKRWACMCNASGLICDGSCKYWTGLLPHFCICLSTIPCFRTALIVLGPLTLALFSWSTANAAAPVWVNVCPCPLQSSQYVQCVAGCLQLMLRVNEYRFAWVEADGVNWWVTFDSLESTLKHNCKWHLCTIYFCGFTSSLTLRKTDRYTGLCRGFRRVWTNVAK